MNHIFQTFVLIMEFKELNWLCKHIKKIRSSKPDILVLNSVKHQSFAKAFPNFFIMHGFLLLHLEFIFGRFAQSDIICTILKTWKNTHTKSNTPLWVFLTFLKLYKCYQIAQNVSYVTISDFYLAGSYFSCSIKCFILGRPSQSKR